MSEQPQTLYLKDYQPAPYQIDSIHLHVDLHEEKTRVNTVLAIQKKPGTPAQTPLVLDGDELKLKTIAIDGHPLSPDRYQVTPEHLTIFNPPEHFYLETSVEIKPQENTKLMGIYKSGGNYTSQCESHGFRRITYFLDRPDVLTRFTTTISADQKRYPLLLSNGNRVNYKVLSDGRHWAQWEDPSLKPCYLFALVAGDFDVVEDTFTTQSQRKIQLQVFVEKGKKEQAYHAMECLKHAMRWDEEAFGREYDLDQYMIVAVNDFNFGAMENKGLNIFNDAYILAKPETATDEDYLNVESVIGHEYFHNWSGNRITVRDWFQITLKEGLTVFREQSFMEEAVSGIAHRISEANIIRNRQFPQDDGPMAHPIRPDHYIEINNFYTVTVYNKGAEVIRMVKTLLGADRFRKAMDLYFSRYDGHAVTTEDFLQAMMDASNMDLTQFKLWYSQAGTPLLKITDHYDKEKQIYTLTIQQSCPATPADIDEKKPFHIPIAFGLLDQQGRELPLESHYQNHVLEIKAAEETFTFNSIPSRPIPSLLRGFSAPVKLQYNYQPEDLMILVEHDTDPFNRWDAMQKLFVHCFQTGIKEKNTVLSSAFIEVFKRVLESETHPMLIAQMLTLPAESYLLDILAPVDIDTLHALHQSIKHQLAESLKATFLSVYESHRSDDGRYHLDSIGKRALKNLCLNYLLSLKTADVITLSTEQWKQAKNMTARMGALQPLMDIDTPERTEALNHFYQQFEKEALSIDKWFRLQAQSDLPDVLKRIETLLKHPKFDPKNPNRARALIGSFVGQNLVHFHRLDGKGYQFLIDQVLAIDKFNPMVAARLIEPMTQWRKMDETRQALMKASLERLKSEKGLSNDVYEIVNKSLV